MHNREVYLDANELAQDDTHKRDASVRVGMGSSLELDLLASLLSYALRILR